MVVEAVVVEVVIDVAVEVVEVVVVEVVVVGAPGAGNSLYSMRTAPGSPRLLHPPAPPP